MKLLLAFLLFYGTSSFAQTNSSPAIAEADGFTIIPNAKFPPDKNRIYKAIYDATKAAKDASEIIPAVNAAGSIFNDLAVSKIALSNAKFVIVFHGAAINSILDDVHYKEKFGVSNPNLKVFSKLKQAGTKLFVCGQNLLADKIDPKTISPDVLIASDALIVLMTYQQDGYALMSF
jgi:intracellular sulfur oxidation DsrE/DsrF family protein